LHVLEDEDGGLALGEPLEQDPPGREEVLLVARCPLTEPSRCASRGDTQRRSSASAMCSSMAAWSFPSATAGSSSSTIPQRIRTISASAQ